MMRTGLGMKIQMKKNDEESELNGLFSENEENGEKKRRDGK